MTEPVAPVVFDMVDPAIDLDRIAAGIDGLADISDIGARLRTLVVPGYDAEGADDQAA